MGMSVFKACMDQLINESYELVSVNGLFENKKKLMSVRQFYLIKNYYASSDTYKMKQNSSTKPTKLLN